MQIGALPLVPYVLGRPELARSLPALDGLGEVQVLDPLAHASTRFGRLLNAANGLAFGTLGMPLWVQLDCATLPSAYHGFALPRDAVDDAQWAELEAAYARIRPERSRAGLDGYDGLVPVSGFCAVRTPDPDTIVAFSLFSILRGFGLGVRTKALGLLAHGASRQMGATQYDNPAIRVHTAFGSLEVVAPRAHGHAQPDKSFVYGLDVPDADTLRARIADGRRDQSGAAVGEVFEPIDDTIARRLAARVENGAPLRIAPPGVVEQDDGAHLVLA
ncbi:MAG: hypothetical protein QNJ98_15255 [Planctomycetota bacterium]|nr:hypothetical protein [Planctomycetota bacterium]